MKKLSFLFLLLFPGKFSAGQGTFEKLYGSTGYEEIWECKILSDSTLIQAGYTGFGNAWLIKTDANGDTLWTRELVDPGSDILFSVEETSDRGIVAAGRTNSYSIGALDIYLVKLDANGNVLWRKTIGGPGDESANEVKETSDNGLIITGNTYSYGAGGNDFYIIKTDSAGNLLWTKTIGGIKNDNAYSVTEAANKDLLITGLHTELVNSMNNIDIFTVRLDAGGNIKWQKKYGTVTGDERGHCITENSSRELIISGLYNGSDFLVMKTDSSGNVIWSNTYTMPNVTGWAYSVINTTDNNLLICGYQNIPGQNEDYFIMKSDQQGNVIWARHYGDQNEQFCTSVAEFYDHTFFASGYSQLGGNDYSFYLVKLDSLGKTSCTNRVVEPDKTNVGLAASVTNLSVSTGGAANTAPFVSRSLGTVETLCESLLSYPTPDEATEIWVYPNPASEILNIEIPDFTGATVELYNITGHKIYASAFTNNIHSLAVRHFPGGIYNLRIVLPGTTVMYKKIVIH